MLLDTTSKKIQVVLGELKTTSECDISAAWYDTTTSTLTAAANDLTTNGTTAVDVVVAPAASTVRQVKDFSVANVDTVSHTVSVQLVSGANTRKLVPAITLKSGYTLKWNPDNGWQVLDTTGSLAAAASFPAVAANLIYAGPGTGSAAPPSFRSAVANDVPGTLNATTAPSFAVTGAAIPATGIFSPAANALGVSTNTLERMRIDASGNVGIGTTTPGAYKLNVNGDIGFGASLFSLSGNTLPAWSGGFEINNESGVGPHIRGLAIQFDVGASTGSPAHPTYVGALAISQAGNVGIGTTTPHSKFAVTGLPIFATNAAAVTGGLAAGDFYRTGADPDPVCVVH